MIILCPDCGEQISSNAPRCHYCGWSPTGQGGPRRARRASSRDLLSAPLGCLGTLSAILLVWGGYLAYCGHAIGYLMAVPGGLFLLARLASIGQRRVR